MIWGTLTCTLTSLIECEIGFCFNAHCFIFFFCTMLIFLFLPVSSIEDSMFNSRSSGQAVAFDPLQFTNFSKVVYIDSKVILFQWYYLCQHWGLIWMYPNPSLFWKFGRSFFCKHAHFGITCMRSQKSFDGKTTCFAFLLSQIILSTNCKCWFRTGNS